MPANPPARIHLMQAQDPEPGWAWCGMQLVYVGGRWRKETHVSGVTCIKCLQRLASYHQNGMQRAEALVEQERARREPVR